MESKPVATKVCKYCKGPHYTTYCDSVTCNECNEYGHAGYVCPKKAKPPPPARSRAEPATKSWRPKDAASRSVGFDVSRVDVEGMEEGIRAVALEQSSFDVLAGKHSRDGKSPSDEDDKPRGKEAKGEAGGRARKAPEVLMLEQPPAEDGKPKKPRKKQNLLLPPMCENLEPYSVIQDIMNRQVTMSFGQLMALCPAQRKALAMGLGSLNQRPKSVSIVLQRGSAGKTPGGRHF